MESEAGDEFNEIEPSQVALLGAMFTASPSGVDPDGIILDLQEKDDD